MKEKLTFRLFENTEEDIRKIKACFEKNDLKKNQSQLEWLYLTGKDGKLESYLAIDQSESSKKLAAMYALFPVEFISEKKKIKALQSLDTLTDTEYRGLGLFKMLSSMSYERCQNEGFQIVYGFPNANSAYGFFNKLGWIEVADVPFLILPINITYFLKKLPIVGSLMTSAPRIPLYSWKEVKDENIRDIEYFDEAINILWEKFSTKFKIAVNRNKDYLTWRFIQKPNENYLIKGLYEQSELVALVVYTIKEKHGGKTGYIMEFIFDPEKEEKAYLLLKYAKNDMVRKKADTCLAWVFDHSPGFHLFVKSGFLRLKKSLRPIELHFGYKKLSNSIDEDLLVKDSWYISYADSDTV